jgi:hypothetical protein
MVHLIPQYLVALVGIVVGFALGWLVVMMTNRRVSDERRLTAWDARVTIPLLLGAAGAHLVLIPVVELQREVMFGCYAVALVVTVAFAIAGLGIWRLGAIVLPAGSILAYAYFAVIGHQADVAGLAVKAVELATIAAALWSLVAANRKHRAPATA